MNMVADEVKSYVDGLAREASQAANHLRNADENTKNHALTYAAAALRQRAQTILDGNAQDVADAIEQGRPDAFVDRLTLTAERVEAMAAGIEAVAALPDPVGRILATFERPNGLTIKRISVPIGVIGMIFESRPNVAADASALCIKSGNAILLRGGSDSLRSTAAIAACMKQGLVQAGLPQSLIQLIDTPDRAAVTHLLRCVDFIDLVIPRGGKGLVKLVMEEARVPTLQHLDGNCHTYIHGAADVDKAVRIVQNAKMRRTGICGATESLIIDEELAGRMLPMLLDAMPECEFRGDQQAQSADARIQPAQTSDFDTEYLAPILSVRISTGLDQALDLVDQHSSRHTDAIVTEDPDAAAAFLQRIDSAVVMHNASTQFSDGGEFGMGAEIGIATGKMHARGPVGLEQLTSFKYQVHGTGQIRS